MRAFCLACMLQLRSDHDPKDDLFDITYVVDAFKTSVVFVADTVVV